MRAWGENNGLRRPPRPQHALPFTERGRNGEGDGETDRPAREGEHPRPAAAPRARQLGTGTVSARPAFTAAGPSAVDRGGAACARPCGPAVEMVDGRPLVSGRNQLGLDLRLRPPLVSASLSLLQPLVSVSLRLQPLVSAWRHCLEKRRAAARVSAASPHEAPARQTPPHPPTHRPHPTNKPPPPHTHLHTTTNPRARARAPAPRARGTVASLTAGKPRAALCLSPYIYPSPPWPPAGAPDPPSARHRGVADGRREEAYRRLSRRRTRRTPTPLSPSIPSARHRGVADGQREEAPRRAVPARARRRGGAGRRCVRVRARDTEARGLPTWGVLRADRSQAPHKPAKL